MQTYAVLADHHQLLWTGDAPLAGIALATEALAAGRCRVAVLFDDLTGRYTDLDGGPAPAEALARLHPVPKEEARRAGPGRPKLGVVAREVSLLPRHWDWLATQPGGASAALRRLVEEARKQHAGRDQARQATDAAYKFMSLVAMDRAGFEEASRALFAADGAGVLAIARQHGWPAELTQHLAMLLSRVAVE